MTGDLIPGWLGKLRQAMPASGLFQDKEWRMSPRPFPLSPDTVQRLERLGPVLHRFQKACNLIYRRSVRGSLPAWVAGYLDRGKPPELIEYGRAAALFESMPRVIRPDLVLRRSSFAVSELDTVPGGIGLTAWLNQTYEDMGQPVIGGRSGMIEGFASMFPAGADVVISQESSGYRPEMEWLVGQLGGDFAVQAAETYRPGTKPVYRFFELFDLKNVPFASRLVRQGQLSPPVNAPMKAYLEEKMWLALFWMKPLEAVWQRELRASNWEWLKEQIPYGWIMDPAPLPHHAVLPRLNVQNFLDIAAFSQKQRNLVLKISGFSDRAWGSRGVHMAMDLPQTEWAEAVQESLQSFEHHPYVLQKFRKGRIVRHPYWDEETGQEVRMKGRVRLCPYYFVPSDAPDARPKLSGVLATICPSDKKILHGMRDAIIVPCSIEEDGY